jgi:hypothetical protein
VSYISHDAAPEDLGFDVKKPHLGLITDASGAAVAIPPGATMLWILDASDAESIIPLMLTKVTSKKWEFRCNCGKPSCTQTFTFAASRRGQHPAR